MWAFSFSLHQHIEVRWYVSLLLLGWFFAHVFSPTTQDRFFGLQDSLLPLPPPPTFLDLPLQPPPVSCMHYLHVVVGPSNPRISAYFRNGHVHHQPFPVPPDVAFPRPNDSKASTMYRFPSESHPAIPFRSPKTIRDQPLFPRGNHTTSTATGTCLFLFVVSFLVGSPVCCHVIYFDILMFISRQE